MTAVAKPNIGARHERQKSWMVKMQSPRVQCCLCACCVMSAVLGMSMLSVGVCLVLNYNLLDVDTSGLPPNLHNDEGKKVVGIILICTGVFSVILSGVVSTLYFTVCTRRTPSTSVGPQDGQDLRSKAAEGGGGEKGAQGRHPSERGAQGRSSADRGSQGRPSSRENQTSHAVALLHHKHLQGNGTTQGRNSPSLSTVSGSRRAGSLQYPRSVSDPANRSLASLGKDGPSFSRGGMKTRTHASSAPSRPHRRGKKGRHSQGRYKNPLAPHPEEAGAESQSLSESRRSASSSRRLQGHVNYGAELDEDLELTQGSVASGGSSGSSSHGHSVVIRVDPSEGAEETSFSPRRSHHEEQNLKVTASGKNIDRHSKLDDDDEEDEDYDEENGEEDGSGRMSRSTMGSQDLSEGPSEGSQSRLDNQIHQLIS